MSDASRPATATRPSHLPFFLICILLIGLGAVVYVNGLEVGRGRVAKGSSVAESYPESVFAGIKRFADERSARLKAQREALDSLE